ncbi:MAG: hypothetical protein IAE80_26630, partial [Anaerolinea sp.]|nr:hypothetical protein [Anaerolinea sp.]
HTQRRVEEALILAARDQSTEDVLASARQSVQFAETVDPALLTNPVFESRLAEIDHLLTLVESVVPDGGGAGEEPAVLPPISTETATPTATDVLTATLTGTPTATSSATALPSVTPTPSASVSPTFSWTPTPSWTLTRTPSVVVTHTPSSTSPRQNPTSAVESEVATDCPGNSCNARASHQPTDRGGGGGGGRDDDDG